MFKTNQNKLKGNWVYILSLLFIPFVVEIISFLIINGPNDLDYMALYQAIMFASIIGVLLVFIFVITTTSLKEMISVTVYRWKSFFFNLRVSDDSAWKTLFDDIRENGLYLFYTILFLTLYISRFFNSLYQFKLLLN